MRKKLNIEDYNDWYGEHKDNWSLNHSDSSGKMEVDAVVKLCKRSVEKFRLQYRNSIRDVLTLCIRFIQISAMKNYCVGCFTQNNESYSQLIWKISPQIVTSGSKTGNNYMHSCRHIQ